MEEKDVGGTQYAVLVDIFLIDGLRTYRSGPVAAKLKVMLIPLDVTNA